MKSFGLVLASMKRSTVPRGLYWKVSLKALDYSDIEQASGNTVRQTAGLQSGIASDKAKELNKMIKGLGIKGVSSSTQGDQLRVQGKKRGRPCDSSPTFSG